MRYRARMNLLVTLASSCSLLASLLVVAPAFADEPPAPAPAVAAPFTAPPPVAAPPAYVMPPGQPPGAPGPWMAAPMARPLIAPGEPRMNRGLIIGGSLTTLLGLGTAAVGGFLYVINTGVVCSGGIDGTGSCGGPAAPGIALMVGGGLAVAGGVTMIVLGARKVSTTGPETALVLRPTGADLRVTF